MDFKTRRIRKEPKKTFKVKAAKFKKKDQPKNNYNMHFATIGGSIVIILFLIFGIYTVIKSLDFSSIVFSFGKTLQTDQNGRTNIMLVGTGGEGHDGSNLTDTIIVASIDYENKLVPMISIPRDFYIMTDKFENQRINSVYDYFLRQYSKKEGIYALKDVVSEITGTEIQYYAFVNFQGFVDIVDAIGGVDIMVEDSIYDPYYPKGETIYFETFQIDAGLQHIDGETALKYARSRKTTSDFDRAKRQQQLLYAIKDKAFGINVLTDAGKITSLYNSVSDSIDTNLSLAEIIEMARLSKEFDKEGIYPAVLNDDPSSCGGLIYTPARDYFAGASVLLPAGGSYDYIHQFVDIILNNTKTIALQEEIQVLNGTKTPGLAGTTMNLLLRNCLNVTYYGNASERPLEKSTIYYQSGTEGEEPETLALVKKLIPVATKPGIPAEYLESERRQDAVIVVELGDDYLDIMPENPFNNLQFFQAPITAGDEDEEESSEDSASIDSTESSEPSDVSNNTDTEPLEENSEAQSTE